MNGADDEEFHCDNDDEVGGMGDNEVGEMDNDKEVSV